MESKRTIEAQLRITFYETRARALVYVCVIVVSRSHSPSSRHHCLSMYTRRDCDHRTRRHTAGVVLTVFRMRNTDVLDRIYLYNKTNKHIQFAKDFHLLPRILLYTRREKHYRIAVGVVQNIGFFWFGSYCIVCVPMMWGPIELVRDGTQTYRTPPAIISECSRPYPNTMRGSRFHANSRN